MYSFLFSIFKLLIYLFIKMEIINEIVFNNKYNTKEITLHHIILF